MVIFPLLLKSLLTSQLQKVVDWVLILDGPQLSSQTQCYIPALSSQLSFPSHTLSSLFGLAILPYQVVSMPIWQPLLVLYQMPSPSPQMQRINPFSFPRISPVTVSPWRLHPLFLYLAQTQTACHLFSPSISVSSKIPSKTFIPCSNSFTALYEQKTLDATWASKCITYSHILIGFLRIWDQWVMSRGRDSIKT